MTQVSSASTPMLENVRYNVTVNILDASVFGLALGLASNMTVLPLFIDTLTNNTALIGLIASIQMIGWQLPQILTAKRVARLGRYKPMAVVMSTSRNPSGQTAPESLSKWPAMIPTRLGGSSSSRETAMPGNSDAMRHTLYAVTPLATIKAANAMRKTTKAICNARWRTSPLDSFILPLSLAMMPMLTHFWAYYRQRENSSMFDKPLC